MCGKSCVGRLAVKTVSLFLIVCTISLLSSCGGGGSSSTTSGGGPNVPPPPTASLTFLQVTPGNASVAASSTQQFSATGKYSDGSSRDLTALVTWGSSSTAVATVDANGLVTAVAAGSTNISATLGSISNSTSLTVTAPTISSISVTPVGLTLGIGINQQ